MPEPLLALLGELEAMAAEDRAAILAALSGKERDLLDRLGRSVTVDRPQGTGVSPWLAEHVGAVRSGASPMTPPAREALLRAVGVPAREPRPAGRSLAGAFGGLLSARGTR